MRILTFLIFLSSVSFATDILSVQLGTDFTYADMDSDCHLQPLGKRFTLVAESENNQIVRARIRRRLMSNKVEVMELSEQEMSELQFSNLGDTLFLTRLLASPRMIDMLFRGGSEEVLKCVPPEGIATMEPPTFLFEFAPHLIEGKPPIHNKSNRAVFRGTTKSGKAFRIDLFVTQELY